MQSDTRYWQCALIFNAEAMWCKAHTGLSSELLIVWDRRGRGLPEYTRCDARCTVLKPVPGSGSRANCAQFHGSSDVKHVSSWFQPWATLWPTCHMLVPASFLLNV